MPLTYEDVVHTLFGEEEFTVGEFERRAGTPRGAKVLSELKKRGVVARVGRGRYRCLAPGERPDLRAAEWRRVRDIVLDAPWPKAWTGSTAVEAWTGGRYRTSSSPFRREFHVAVDADDVDAWRTYLRDHGVSVERHRHIGARVVLEPREDLEDVVTVMGEPVVPRDEVERLIREHPASYGPAEELLLDRPRGAGATGDAAP